MGRWRPRLAMGELGRPEQQKSRPPPTHLGGDSQETAQIMDTGQGLEMWAPPCISEDWGVRGRRRKLGLEVSRPESLLPVCREVTASESCSGERREAMATSGKLAKGLRPPSLCPHGAYWPWLKIVQFLHCCCH